MKAATPAGYSPSTKAVSTGQALSTAHEPDEHDHDEPYCTICGCPMDWADCWQCGGEGEFDVYDEDPMWYSPGDTETCEVCHGAGGYWECTNLPHEKKELQP